jgi:hypothetical protein
MSGTAKEWDELMRERLDVSRYAETLRDRRVPRFVDEAPKNDEVNRPEHYNTGKVECIEAIKASMSAEEFKGYLKGNTLKYLWRYNYKGKPKQDLQKAQWYLNKLIEEAQ